MNRLFPIGGEILMTDTYCASRAKDDTAKVWIEGWQPQIRSLLEGALDDSP
jgi:hypothetical protein